MEFGHALEVERNVGEVDPLAIGVALDPLRQRGKLPVREARLSLVARNPDFGPGTVAPRQRHARDAAIGPGEAERAERSVDQRVAHIRQCSGRTRQTQAESGESTRWLASSVS